MYIIIVKGDISTENKMETRCYALEGTLNKISKT